jgi:periplasmic divalent cation tolerance protein
VPEAGFQNCQLAKTGMYSVIFITAPNRKEAKKIAQALVGGRLCACVNIIDKVESLFWWQGKYDMAREVLLIIKTKKNKLRRIIRLVKSLHSYSVPEIIALPITGGHEPYLRWIEDSVD